MTEDAAETAESSVDAEDGSDGESDVEEDGSWSTESDTSEGGSDLSDRVAEYDEALADEVQDIEVRLAEVESSLADAEERADDLESRLKRKQADFENYKKRAKKRREQTKARATEDLVERLVGVRDNLVRALDQDEDVGIRGGIESTLETFDRVLEDENVTVVEPSPGDEVDPRRHEVMMRVESERPAGTVVDLYRPGYEMADRVIQTAQVTVSDGDDGAA